VKGEIDCECSQYGIDLKNIKNFVCKIELKRNPDSLADIVTLYNLNDQGSEVRFLKGRRSFSLISSAQTSSYFHPVYYSESSGCHFSGFKVAMA